MRRLAAVTARRAHAARHARRSGRAATVVRQSAYCIFQSPLTICTITAARWSRPR
jgi:hypothetical protein